MDVLLFDIDGTLILTGGAGGTAFMSAFSETFDVPDPETVPFSGRTDRWIAHSLFKAHDIPDSSQNWTRLRTEYLQRLAVQLPRHPGRILPGIVELLEQLAATPQTTLGLLTGNACEGARLKLEHFDLFHHFQFGGFGDLHTNRSDVARAALLATLDHLQQPIAPQKVWVIGDTPMDVECGRAIGARTVAVATGWHERSRLEQSAPDLLLDTLEDAEPLLSQLGME